MNNKFDFYYPTERDPLVLLPIVSTDSILVRRGGDDNNSNDNRFLRCGFFSERFRGKLLLVVTGLLLFIVMFMNSSPFTEIFADNEGESESQVADGDGGKRSFITFSIMNLINFLH